MALKSCRECGGQVSTQAKTCPNCGVANPTRRGFTVSAPVGCLLVSIFVVAMCFYGLSEGLREEAGARSPGTETTTSAVNEPSQGRAVRFAKSRVNVREGPGTEYVVVNRLENGDPVWIDSLTNGWYVVSNPSGRLGYVASSLLVKTKPPPTTSPGPSTPAPTSTGVRSTNAGYVLCYSESDLDKAIDLAASGDRVAFAKFIEGNPLCGITVAGARVYVTKTKVFSGKVRIRPEGETTEFWTLTEAVN